MQVEKVTNALWVKNIAPIVMKFVDRMAVPNISYYTMMQLLEMTAQFGGEAAELWVSVNEKMEPEGFARWHCMAAPMIATAYWDYVYTEKKDIVPAFIDKYLEFAERMRCSYLMADLVNNKVAKHFATIADSKKLTSVEVRTKRLLYRR